jgi:hypothetical protein
LGLLGQLGQLGLLLLLRGVGLFCLAVRKSACSATEAMTYSEVLACWGHSPNNSAATNFFHSLLLFFFLA